MTGIYVAGSLETRKSPLLSLKITLSHVKYISH